MANSKQAIKRAKQNETHRERNQSQRASMRTAIKALLKSIEANDKDAATSAYQTATAIIDKNASKGLHHRNRAARLKSRLNARMKKIAA